VTHKNNTKFVQKSRDKVIGLYIFTGQITTCSRMLGVYVALK